MSSWQDFEVECTDYLNDTDKIVKDIEKLGYPVIVKPATLGSSVGISYVKDDNDLANLSAVM